MQYLILEERTATGLANKVMEFLNKGWELQGGISVGFSFSPGGSQYETYCQALIQRICLKD